MVGAYNPGDRVLVFPRGRQQRAAIVEEQQEHRPGLVSVLVEGFESWLVDAAQVRAVLPQAEDWRARYGREVNR